MRRTQPDAILGFISGSSVNIWFMHSVFNLFKADAENRFGADWMLVFGPYIHQNRNRLADQFLDEDREWLFMVDNDMVFNPEDVWALFEVADENGPGIYAGPYLLEDANMACGVWEPEMEFHYHPLVKLPEDPRPIGVVGAGFTLIHREVFTSIGGGGYTALGPSVGEDVSFSWRAREAGYTPWLVPAANPGHFKQVALYPHEEVRNMVGEEVNLVEAVPT